MTPNYLILGQAEFEIENIRKEIKRMLGENGAKCFSTLEMLSEEGFLHAIPYLEDMIKVTFFRLMLHVAGVSRFDNCPFKCLF